MPPHEILARVDLPFKRLRSNELPIRSEADEKAMRKNIERLLRQCGQEDLRRVYKVIKALVEL